MTAFIGNQRHNVFVPTFAPQFKAMRDKGGIPGVSLEDPKRGGVWVPIEWLIRQQDTSTHG